MTGNRRGFAYYFTVAVLAFVGALGLSWLATERDMPSSVKAQVTTHGEWIWITKPTGDSIRAYLAFPERKEAAPAVIVIHEIFGLTDWEPTVVDRLAAKGYVVIAPDLLSSRFGPSPARDSARKLMALLTPEGITADMEATYGRVNGLTSVKKGQIGVIGFCWGGGQSFRYATNNPNLKAAVVCYGPPPTTTEGGNTTVDSAALARIKAPILGIYGENDNRINSTLPRVTELMGQLGKRFESEIFPGAGHGFLKPGMRGSETEQPKKAWARIERFFAENLTK